VAQKVAVRLDAIALFYFRSSTVTGNPLGERRGRRPVSRVLSPAPSGRRGMAIPLGRPSPDVSRDLPGRLARKPAFPPERERRPYSVLLPVGFTVPSPLPATRCALTAPFHPHPQVPVGLGGQTALCGTFPGVAPAGRYPAPCFRGARTFLPRVAPRAAIRPPDPTQMSPRMHAISSAHNSASSPSRRANVAWSGTPSTRSGRKWR
jgi:hypothetical protein